MEVTSEEASRKLKNLSALSVWDKCFVLEPLESTLSEMLEKDAEKKTGLELIEKGRFQEALDVAYARSRATRILNAIK